MKTLDIAHFQQLQEKDCLAACLNIVMTYHEADEAYEDMVRNFDFYSIGLSFPQIGKYALQKGFNVQIDTLNPYLFNAKDLCKSQADIYKKIGDLAFEDEEFKMLQQCFLEYMDAGGKLQPHLPVKEDIIDEIENNHPVIIQFASNIIHGYKDGYNFHANVVCGYDNKDFLLFDPANTERFGLHKVNQDMVMYAVAVNGYADLDNAAILKISP